MLIYRTSREDGDDDEVEDVGTCDWCGQEAPARLLFQDELRDSEALRATRLDLSDTTGFFCHQCIQSSGEDEDVGLNITGLVPCGACGGEAHLLGALGAIAHYRCRDCGAESHDVQG